MIGKTIMTKTNTETTNKYGSLDFTNILVTEENKFNYGYPIKSIGHFDIAVIFANIVSKKSN